jgi:hypothetical protein
MSSYSDISQLLDGIGTSDRSASDPWTISRSNQGTVKRSSFSPAVVADLGASAKDLTSDIQSSEQIAKADEIPNSPTGASAGGSAKSSIGSGLLGGLLSLFPLPSVVGKLFGLGGSASPPPLTPFIQPPSVSFQGAMSGSLSHSTTDSLMGAGSTPHSSSNSSSGSQSQWAQASESGFESLSYNAEGLPRTADSMPTLPTDVTGTSRFIADDNSSPNATGQFGVLTSPPPASESPAYGPTTTLSHDVMGQLSSLTSANFTSEPAFDSSIRGADLLATTSLPSPQSGSLSASSNGSSTSPPGAEATASNSSQGQSILVQVQAMDSQSFMDHSNDIAQAVRQAMLNLHSVNDVIADL